MAAVTSKLRATAAVVLAGLCLVASAGCKKDPAATTSGDDPDDPALLAQDGTDSNAAESDAEVVTTSLISATASGGSLSLASSGELGVDGVGTQSVGDGAKAIYFPRGCLTVTSDDAAKTVTYAFNDCAGPNGILKIRGEIKATYTVTPGKLVLDLVGTGLVVNRSTVDWSATAEITAVGAAREMRWHGSLSGTTARGKDFARTNDKVVTWRFGERCYGVSGVSEGNVRERYLRTEITDYRRCAGSCPEAGGKISITNAQAKVKIEILFDGTSHATFIGPKGSTSFDLLCSG